MQTQIETTASQAAQPKKLALNMAARRIRSIVARVVVVTGLAASLLVDSSALVAPPDASAAVNIQRLFAAQVYYDLGDYYASVKNYVVAARYYRLGDMTLASC